MFAKDTSLLAGDDFVLNIAITDVNEPPSFKTNVINGFQIIDPGGVKNKYIVIGIRTFHLNGVWIFRNSTDVAFGCFEHDFRSTAMQVSHTIRCFFIVVFVRCYYPCSLEKYQLSYQLTQSI